MSESAQIVSGLAFYGLLSVSLYGYYAWKAWIRRKPVLRSADRAAAAFTSDPTEARKDLQILVPSLVSANAGLAGITFAALVIVIAFILIESVKLEGLKLVITYVVLGLAGVATISWLFCLEHLTIMLDPGITPERMLKLYRWAMHFWSIGMILIVQALVLFLLLANLYVSAVAGLTATAFAVIYWKNSYEW